MCARNIYYLTLKPPLHTVLFKFYAQYYEYLLKKKNQTTVLFIYNFQHFVLLILNSETPILMLVLRDLNQLCHRLTEMRLYNLKENNKRNKDKNL